MEVNIDISDCQAILDPINYVGCIRDIVKDVTLEAEGQCKVEAPVDTGNLMNSHSTEIGDNKGTVYNNSPYWQWVVYGRPAIEASPGHALHFFIGKTEIFAKSVKAVPANDYPQRALTTLEGKVDDIIEKNRKSRGI